MKRVVIVMTVCALLAGCGGKTQMPKATNEFQVTTLDTSSAVIYTDFPAEVQSGTVVEIRPRISGYIDKILVEEGSRIRKGQTLFVINKDDITEQYNSAVANAEVAKSKVDNVKLEITKLTPLVGKGIISKFELENAQSNLAAAEASHRAALSQMRNAQVNMGYASITSPVDGFVGRIVVREGTLIAPTNQAPLTTVSGDGDIAAYFSINEKIMQNLVQTSENLSKSEIVAKLPKANLVMSNGQIYQFDGKLELASGLVDMTTGSMQIKGVFKNPDNAIRSGSSGIVRLGRSVNGVILVPQKSTYEVQDKKMVFVVDSENKVHSQSLMIEGTSGENYVVSAGVQKGDRIVLEGVDFLKEGDVITTK